MRRTVIVILWCVCLLGVVAMLSVRLSRGRRPAAKTTGVLRPMVLSEPEVCPPPKWRPPNVLKVWTTRYRGKVFRVTQLPRSDSIETLITYDLSGETIARAKKRVGGVAAIPGSFHHPKSLNLADFLQRQGRMLVGARTGRFFLAIECDGRVTVSNEYSRVKRSPGISALALGQRLLPLKRDKFSLAFMNQQTDRIALAMNSNYMFIVQGKSDIWKLAQFIRVQLPATSAINCDGGHVVRGKAPVHVVFRWRKGATKPR